MANHIAKVAQMLGVEIGEVFQISPLKYCFFKFTDDFLAQSVKNKDNDDWIIAKDSRLRGLLNGRLSIRKLPWKPTKGEKYYFPNTSDYKELCDVNLWDNDEFDENLYRQGLVFKTREEAVALTKKMLAVAKEVRNDG